MIDDNKYRNAFEMIASAGNSRAASMLAIQAAKDFDFETAEKHLEEADSELKEAHKTQFEMIQQEAQGNSVDVNILLVHAQDHLIMAMMAKDNAQEFLELYKTIKMLMDGQKK